MPAKSRSSVPLHRIAEAIKAEVVGDAGAVKVTGVSSLEGAGPKDLAYVAAERFARAASQSRAAAFVVGRRIPDVPRPQLIVANPAYAFACIAHQFFTPPYRATGIAKWVMHGKGVRIGRGVSIHSFVTLGDRVKIGSRVTLHCGVSIGDECEVGDDTVLYPNVTIRERCRIGRRVIIHSGAVVGSDGFGYVQHEGRHHKIPQMGTVIIEDDVELGANVTVDRATFGQTVVGRGTKVDNLVQIAHNVIIGEDSLLAGQVGIAGSAILGHHVVVGGQAGVGDHLTIGDRVMIAARSGVMANLKAGQIVSGSPAMLHQESGKVYAVVVRLPEFRQRVRQLERRLLALESRMSPPETRKREEDG